MTIDDLSGIDRLNRLLDHPADRSRRATAGDGERHDAEWDPTLRRLRQLDAALAPPPGTLARIRADLGLPAGGGRGGASGGETGAPTVVPDGERSRASVRRLPRSLRRWSILAEVATAAIVVLSLLSGYLWYLLLESERKPEPAVVAPGPEACLVAPKEFDFSEMSRVYFPAMNAAGSAPAETSTAPTANANAGQPADRATADAIAGAVRELVACSNSGSHGRFLALTTTRYQRTYLDQAAASYSNGAERAVASFELSSGGMDPLPEHERLAVRDISRVSVLPDGRVAAVLELERPLSTTPNERRQEVAVFERGADRWLLEHGLAPPVPSLGATPTP